MLQSMNNSKNIFIQEREETLSNELISKKRVNSDEADTLSAVSSSTESIFENKSKDAISSTQDLKKKENLKFPQQLMKILSREEFEGIIAWNSDGKSFTIHNRNRLDEIWKFLEFPDAKFDSFRRKLHRWGFKVVRRGEANAGAYYHKRFLRNDPSICMNMKSISAKNLKKATSHISNRKYSTDLVSKKHSQALNSLPIDVKNITNKHAEELLLLNHRSYWLKRKSLFNKYIITSFQQMQLGKNHLLQNSRNIPKMAPKKNFKNRMDENLNDFRGYRRYDTKEEFTRDNKLRCVKKARAA